MFGRVPGAGRGSAALQHLPHHTTPTPHRPSPPPPPSRAQVMHAFIDGEQYSGLSLDDALRALLAQFRCACVWCVRFLPPAGGGCCASGGRRGGWTSPPPHTHMQHRPWLPTPPPQCRLPGEAQKIDRIMEKFAERYCADNPGERARL